MCLYPREMKNKRYEPTKKNGGNVPSCPDDRLRSVPVPCGNCKECRKKKKQEWMVRLSEDIKHHKNGKFVTLTFNNEKLLEHEKLVSKQIQGYERENKAVSIAMTRFLERWRKTYGKSVRHCLITELGHRNTERIHLHGFIWTDEDGSEIARHWKNGDITIGEKKYYVKNISERKTEVKIGYGTEGYVNEKSVNYITKYINKLDKDHKYYKSKMYISNGIGKGYEDSIQFINNMYRGKKGEDTIETYTTRKGVKVSLPKYYREKLYTERQREQLWINKLNLNIRYVNKTPVDISENMEAYYKVRNEARVTNTFQGYGSNWKDTIIEYLENSNRNRLAWCRANGKNPRMIKDPQKEVYNQHQESILKVTKLEHDTKKIEWDINPSAEKKFRKPTKAKKINKLIEENKENWGIFNNKNFKINEILKNPNKTWEEVTKSKE